MKKNLIKKWKSYIVMMILCAGCLTGCAGGTGSIPEKTDETENTVSETVEEEPEKIPEDGFDKEKAEQAFDAVNEQREAEGVEALLWNDDLYELACIRAQEIVSQFSHQRPDGSFIGELLLEEYEVTGCGENIASNYDSVTKLMEAWLNSAGYRENMLDERFSAGAMACYCSERCYYWVNLFQR